MTIFGAAQSIRSPEVVTIAETAGRIAEIARSRLQDAAAAASDEEREKIFAEVRGLVEQSETLNSTARTLLRHR